MPKRAKELTALQVRRLVHPGLYAVGGVVGLYLQVRSASARSWILNVTAGQQRRMFGLGSYPTILIDAARDKARAYRTMIENGTDPIVERRKLRAGLLAAKGRVADIDEAAKAVVAVKPRIQERQAHGTMGNDPLDVCFAGSPPYPFRHRTVSHHESAGTDLDHKN